MVSLKTLENQIFNFVDLETTGSNFNRDRVVEISIYKYLDGEVISKYSQLIKPAGFKKYPLTFITGITDEMLADQPFFEQIADEIFENLKDGIMVAHNARFDYSFLKAEFLRQSLEFNMDYLCTLKMSRRLYSSHKRHGLDAIIERHGLDAIIERHGLAPHLDLSKRHRAETDTKAMQMFFEVARNETKSERFLDAVNHSISKKAVPKGVDPDIVQTLPQGPGVYIFKGEQGDIPLYIGMSKNIRRRVQQHFYSDLRETKEMRINNQLRDIDFIQTAGVLGAALLESHLIKEKSPLYNQQLRRQKQVIKVELESNEDGYLTLQILENHDLASHGEGSDYAIFERKSHLKAFQDELSRDLKLCHKLIGIESGSGECFNYQLGKCSGACCKAISIEEYNHQLIRKLRAHMVDSWPFDSAILVREESPTGEVEEFVIDNWVLTEVRSQGDLSEMQIGRFELDTFKIIKRYMHANPDKVMEA